MSTLHDHLRVRKRCARRTPLLLTNNDRVGISGVGVHAAEVQWRPFKIAVQSANMWRNLDLAMWSGNQDEVGGPAVSQWVHTPQTQKITQYTEDTGRPILWKIGPCRRHCSWGQTDRLCGLVQAPPSPESLHSLCQRRPQTALRGFLFILTMPGAHNGNNGLLFRWERGAAATAHTVLTRPLSPPLLPIHSNEKTTEGYSVRALL